MKNDVMHSIVQMDRNVLNQLVTEVHETVATDVEFPKARKSSFGAVKLLNIRRYSRYAAHARNKNPGSNF